jgi:hypothetical protein
VQRDPALKVTGPKLRVRQRPALSAGMLDIDSLRENSDLSESPAARQIPRKNC